MRFGNFHSPTMVRDEFESGWMMRRLVERTRRKAEGPKGYGRDRAVQLGFDFFLNHPEWGDDTRTWGLKLIREAMRDRTWLIPTVGVNPEASVMDVLEGTTFRSGEGGETRADLDCRFAVDAIRVVLETDGSDDAFWVLALFGEEAVEDVTPELVDRVRRMAEDVVVHGYGEKGGALAALMRLGPFPDPVRGRRVLGALRFLGDPVDLRMAVVVAMQWAESLRETGTWNRVHKVEYALLKNVAIRDWLGEGEEELDAAIRCL